jgi:hypothetical protein
LANLFLHYAYDAWMQRTFPNNPFERYADDAIVHCGSEKEARLVLEAIRVSLADCGLELHPVKTKIVYCKDDRRRGRYENITFRFPRVFLSASTSEEPVGKGLPQFPAGDQCRGRQGDTPDHPRMADGVHQE